MAEVKTRILLRNDVLANWEAKNPVLGKGEFAAVYDPSVSGEGRKIRVKVGDGVTAFKSLPYVSDYDDKIKVIENALDTKIAKTAETYNLPYYFEVIYAADKVTVKDYTVDLNTGEKREYSLDIAAATTEKAGIMTAADKVEVNKVANKADTTYVDTKDAETLASAKQYTDEQIAALPKVNYKVVETLPAPSAEYDFNVCRTIFLVKDTAVGADVYNEFVCIKNDQNVYVWEKIGDTRIDLSAYRKAADQDVIDAAIRAEITAEASTRETADTALQTNINNEATTRANADSAIRIDLNIEKQARSDADDRLADAIETEATLRDETDAALLDKIGNEKSRAMTAEAALQTNITNEATRAQTAEANLQTAVDAKQDKFDIINGGDASDWA